MAQDAGKTRRKHTRPTLMARGRAKVRLGASPISSSAPPVTILGTGRRYHGGYRVHV